ncbi:uncharacterized protein TNCV_3722071 [Trichonephila clavipes]|nr:uncharacterized protein TNCV_3722071 [Trichonephila clavipes]
MDCVQECLYARSSSRQTIIGCFCNGLMSTEPGKLIGTKLSFLMNHAYICGTMMMAAFLLDAMPSNSAFQSALSNDIVAQRTKLWFGVRFCIMGKPICHELSVLSVE